MKQRVRADVTRGELVWTVAGVFLIGSIFGWAAFGVFPFPSAVLEDSSIADIIAAIGTWVIGFGAWKYARETFRHNLDTTQRRDEADLQMILSRINQAMVKITRGRGIKRQIDKITAEDKGKLTHSFVATSIQFARNAAKNTTFSDIDRTILSSENVVKYAAVETCCEWFCLGADQMLSQLKADSNSTISEDIAAQIDDLVKLSNRANDTISECLGVLKAERKARNTDLKKLTQRKVGAKDNYLRDNSPVGKSPSIAPTAQQHDQSATENVDAGNTRGRDKE